MYDQLADLPVRIEDLELERRERDTSSGFERVTTTVVLRGPDAVGRGEDVTYEAADHDAWLAAGPPDLAGAYRFDEFSAALGDLELFPEPPEREAARRYRRWALESAALDLALRGADTDLGAALGEAYDPLRFVASTRLGEPPTADRVHRFLAVDGDTEFKLDPTPEWTPALVEELAETGAVRVVDLKAGYEGTDVDNPPDPDLYELVAEGFPGAVIEDPGFTPETRPVLEGERSRLAFDYAVTGVASLADLPVEPAWVNVKPSRFGTVESLLATVEHCRAEGIGLYAGGQFELGVGRRHVQSVASLLFPDGPNDIAPPAYNDPEVPDDLPTSPLEPTAPRGLDWRAGE